MSARRYKEPSQQSVYEAMIAAAFDSKSELYTKRGPREGALHRCSFWAGFYGDQRPVWVVRRTMANACYCAGVDFKRMVTRRGS